mmetsp:Transcript_67616/g.218370  ORF Transcript_67616/g.218370 Transcript_67616/m.218370 type:complete len:260 (-) Transcript_67616:1388-2167(-)
MLVVLAGVQDIRAGVEQHRRIGGNLRDGPEDHGKLEHCHALRLPWHLRHPALWRLFLRNVRLGLRDVGRRHRRLLGLLRGLWRCRCLRLLPRRGLCRCLRLLLRLGLFQSLRLFFQFHLGLILADSIFFDAGRNHKQCFHLVDLADRRYKHGERHVLKSFIGNEYIRLPIYDRLNALPQEVVHVIGDLHFRPFLFWCCRRFIHVQVCLPGQMFIDFTEGVHVLVSNDLAALGDVWNALGGANHGHLVTWVLREPLRDAN